MGILDYFRDKKDEPLDPLKDLILSKLQPGFTVDYERKTMLLLQKMRSGDLDQAEADRLATEASSKKEEAIQRGQTLMSEHRQQQAMSDQLQAKV